MLLVAKVLGMGTSRLQAKTGNPLAKHNPRYSCKVSVSQHNNAFRNQQRPPSAGLQRQLPFGRVTVRATSCLCTLCCAGSGSLILELHTAVFSTVRSLLGSGRHGQAKLYPFQKHTLYWEEQYIVTMELLRIGLNVVSYWIFVSLKTIELLQRSCRVLRVTR